MKIYLTTDTHFGHKMLIEKKYRPSKFEDLIANGFKQLNEDDLLIHLGDVCMSKEAEHHYKYIKSLKCKKVLVLGNHDKKSTKWYLEHGWDFVCYKFSDKFFGKKIIFSHKPVKPSDNYQLNIHGHFHDNDHRSDEEIYQYYDDNYHINLSLEDNNYMLFSLEKVLKKYVNTN